MYNQAVTIHETVEVAEGTTVSITAQNRFDAADPEIRVPTGAEILGFGVTVTTTMSADTDRPKFSLQKASRAGGSYSTISGATVTIPASAAAGERIVNQGDFDPHV